MLPTDTAFMDAISDAIKSGIKSKFDASYGPFKEFFERAVKANESAIMKLLTDSIKGCLDDAEFTTSVQAAVRQNFAKTLVQRFGGELERQINALKSDPTTRARIVLALEEIVAKNTPK